ncbi:MAG: hypothetical protein EBX52_08980 [Proteobacteria bacterium]|nr:hypothetical protein [Pseudomonadota bacterium]
MVKPVSKQLRISFLAGCLVLGAHVPGVSHADDGGVAENLNNSFKPDRILEARILADPALPKHTKRVSWVPGAIKVTTRYFGSSSESVLSLQGRLEREDASKWNVIWNEKSFDVGRGGVFELKIPYDAGFKNLELALVGPKGEVEYHFYQLELAMPAIPVASEIEARESELPAGEFNQKLKRNWFVSPGLGISSLSYRQTAIDSYQSIVMTAKVSANYFIAPPKWDLGFTGFFNFVSLFSETDPRNNMAAGIPASP